MEIISGRRFVPNSRFSLQIFSLLPSKTYLASMTLLLADLIDVQMLKSTNILDKICLRRSGAVYVSKRDNCTKSTFIWMRGSL